ncbi:hypothetical protein GOODEAATRI_014532 [Goodea atripinnis]|uniref:STIM1/2 EF-hand domain-containing protein n=1 Tax=Goodea atripinnis TaxID=208336 RepID=A0ABV0NC23_9TELE
MPPCVGEADRFSLEALRHIHKQLDDDNDGGIEVNESVEPDDAVLKQDLLSVTFVREQVDTCKYLVSSAKRDLDLMPDGLAGSQMILTFSCQS